MLSETDIINRYFKVPSVSSKNILGIGDDAAIIEIPVNEQLVVTIDSLNEGIHFLKDVNPADLGFKALAVSLSDIAAMGAKPFSALLSLSLPEVNETWLKEFSHGFFSLAKKFNVDLIGGDTTRGVLSVTTVVQGTVPQGKAICRHGAQVGDLIYVTGTLGDAGLALDLLNRVQKVDPSLLARLNRPSPRVDTGMALRDIASSAMDLSDGLVLDLTRLCEASGVGAKIFAEQLPLSPMLQQSLSEKSKAQHFALTAGDDYELVFTVPPHKKDQLKFNTVVSCIGEIVAGSKVQVLDSHLNMIVLEKKGYDHFQN